MITYKHEAYVAQAIESILAQEVDFAFELVIGEDCGGDATLTICEKFAGQDSRIRLLPSERNLGVMKNFLRTLQACAGEYVAVCEGDDYWTDRSKLQKQVAQLESNRRFAGSAHQCLVIVDEKPARLFREKVPAEITTLDLIGGRLFHTASIVFRRQALDLLAAAPDVLSGDRLLNFCVSFLGPIHYSEDCMCAYRLHAAGMSSNASVAQMKMDLNSVGYLKTINPAFPRYRYTSYVYATIALCRAANWHQKIRFLALSFLYSFSYFPENLIFMTSRIAKAVRARVAFGGRNSS